MAARSTIMVVTREPATEQAIGSALEKSGRLELAGVCPGLTELTLRLDRAPAGAVLVDIDPEPHSMLRTLDRIAARFGGTRFVVVASTIERSRSRRPATGVRASWLLA